MWFPQVPDLSLTRKTTKRPGSPWRTGERPDAAGILTERDGGEGCLVGIWTALVGGGGGGGKLGRRHARGCGGKSSRWKSLLASCMNWVLLMDGQSVDQFIFLLNSIVNQLVNPFSQLVRYCVEYWYFDRNIVAEFVGEVKSYTVWLVDSQSFTTSISRFFFHADALTKLTKSLNARWARVFKDQTRWGSLDMIDRYDLVFDDDGESEGDNDEGHRKNAKKRNKRESTADSDTERERKKKKRGHEDERDGRRRERGRREKSHSDDEKSPSRERRRPEEGRKGDEKRHKKHRERSSDEGEDRGRRRGGEDEQSRSRERRRSAERERDKTRRKSRDHSNDDEEQRRKRHTSEYKERHKVDTPCRAISYRTISCHTIPYHTIPYHIISCLSIYNTSE